MKQLTPLSRLIADAEAKGHDIDSLMVESDAVCYLKNNPDDDEESDGDESEEA